MIIRQLLLGEDSDYMAEQKYSFIIEHNEFWGQSKGVVINENALDNVDRNSVNFDLIIKELQDIKRCLSEKSTDYQIVQELEVSAKQRNWDKLSNTVHGFLTQFSSTVLANLTGAYLCGLLKL